MSLSTYQGHQTPSAQFHQQLMGVTVDALYIRYTWLLYGTLAWLCIRYTWLCGTLGDAVHLATGTLTTNLHYKGLQGLTELTLHV